MASYTESAFEQLSFHDNLFRGMAFRVDERTSDLVLDIDHVVEWFWCDAEGRYEWNIAAADLVFHGVTGLPWAVRG